MTVAQHYFEVELTPAQRRTLLLLLRGGSVTEALLRDVEEAVRDARRIDRPLNKERLDWEELEHEAKRRGCSEADAIWDKGRMKEPE